MLKQHLGDDHPFEATSPWLPGVTRRFASFTDAAKENRLARVHGGIHFVRAIEDGAEHGNEIGRKVSRSLPTAGR